MATLYCLSHSPSTDPFQAHLLELAAEGDGVILIEDAVYAAGPAITALAEPVAAARRRGVKLWVLEPDLAARGVCSDLPAVGYPGFVELVVSHDRFVH
jgi:tRNA 2-thiouridine synthesizing protein B